MLFLGCWNKRWSISCFAYCFSSWNKLDHHYHDVLGHLRNSVQSLYNFRFRYFWRHFKATYHSQHNSSGKTKKTFQFSGTKNLLIVCRVDNCSLHGQWNARDACRMHSSHGWKRPCFHILGRIFIHIHNVYGWKLIIKYYMYFN